MMPALRQLPLLLGLSLVLPVSVADEIILTKQLATERASEDVQWTPESITIIERKEIEASHRRDLQDLSGYVPGMVFDSIGTSSKGAAISIRGIGSHRSNNGLEPAVSVSVDGIYIGAHANQNQVLFDFERVEIARGPQGTFSGPSAEAGSINIQRTRPTGKFDLETHLGFGEFNTTYVNAVFNFPITDNLSGKITGRLTDNENYGISNLDRGRKENSIRDSAFSASLLWQKTENLSVLYTLDYERDDSDTPALVNLSNATDLVCVPVPGNERIDGANCGRGGRTPETSTNRTLQNFSNDRRYDGLHHTLRIDSRWRDLQISSITGFRSTEERTSVDLDATFVDLYSSTIQQDYDQFSTELKVRGDLNESTNFAVGAYWLDAKYDLDRQDFFVLDTLLAGGRLPPSNQSNRTVFTDSQQDNSIRSLFAYIDHEIDELWSADFGGRFNSYKKKFDHSRIYDDNATAFKDNDDWSEFSANTSISYNVVDEDAMIYLRLGVAYTPGGFYDRAISPESAPYRNSQETKNVELGMKSEWLEQRLRLNMAFYQNYQDEKIEELAILTSNGNIEATLGNIAEIEVRGFDLEFEYAALANLYIRGTYSHMNATYERYDVPDLTDPLAIVSLADSLAPNRAPDDTYFVSAQYSIPFRSGLINLYAGFHRVASYQTNPLIDIAEVRLYSKWDASIDYQMKNFTIRLFGQNLINDRYLLNYENSFDAQIASISGQTGIQGIATTAERNRPQYIGVDFIWKPNLNFLD